MKAELKLEIKWDKTFPKSDKVKHSKATFHNRYGITLAADLYEPTEAAVDFLSVQDNVDPLPEDAPFFVKDYYDYYKIGRGPYGFI